MGASALPLPAIAATDPVLPRAVQLLERRDAAAAYAALQAEEHRLAGDPDFDYLLGIAALDAGHVTPAIFALERVVASRPDNALARAELARAYLAAGEVDSARAELEAARRGQLPRAASEAIDRVLGALDQTLPTPQAQWSAHVELGTGWDSNVNSANNAGEFAIPAFGGLVFAVDRDDRERSDAFLFAAAGADLQFPLDAIWKVVAGAEGRSTANRHAHDMDVSVLDGTLGLSRTVGAHRQTLALQTSSAWVGSDAYRRANGLSAQWQSQLDAASQWNAFVQWSRQEYADEFVRNTDRTVLGTAFAQAFESTATLAYGSVYAVEERARHAGFEYFGHHGFGARLGAEQSVRAGATLFAEAQHERRRYGSTEPLFDFQRIDRQTDLLLGLRWTPQPGWSVTPSIRHTAAPSNVPLYDYDRTVVQVSVRKEFP